jgi:maltose alpha-D-glucosyltransferase/alpha-amylase
MFHLLRRQRRRLPEPAQVLAQQVLDLEPKLFERLKGLLGPRFTAMRIRHHGDFHLGQVLQTGNDFVIIDFEGEPARSLADRRLKRGALRDVAGMLRSFAYAAYTSLAESRDEDRARFDPWTTIWLDAISGVFLGEYLSAAGSAPFVPRGAEELATTLDVYLIEKAVYEVMYELDNRPDWVSIPLRGLAAMLA